VRFFKWVSLGLGALVALVVLGVLVIVWLVDPNSFRSNIEARVRSMTGRDFKLAGDIELGFFPWIALRTGQGSFGNAPGFGPEPMVSWKSAQIGAKVFPLLRGELIADRVHITGADLRLVRRADGTNNWQDLGGDSPAEPAKEPIEVHIDGVQIEDSQVLFVDETVPRRIEVTDLDLDTGTIKVGNPFSDTQIYGVLHMDGFVPEGVPFHLDLPKLVLPQDFASVEVDQFELKFGDLGVEGHVKGTLGEHPKLSGAIATTDFDPRALLTSVGIAPPKTTDAKAFGKLSFGGSWNFDAGAIGINPFSLTLDDTRFKGKFHRAAGDNPIGEFTLQGDDLDLSRYIPPTDPASKPFVMPTAMLKSLMFRGSVELEHATLDDIDMKGVTLRLLLDEQGLRSMPKTPEDAR